MRTAPLFRLISRALLASVMVVPALAQDATTDRSAERSTFAGSGGTLTMVTKSSSGFSGSLGASFSSSDDVFGNRRGNRYDATVGGTLIEDRLHFFASGGQQQSRAVAFNDIQPLGAAPANGSALDARMYANLGDRHTLGAMFSRNDQPVVSTTLPMNASLPTSFLSMRYTGIVSDSMFFTANLSRRSIQSNSGVLPVE
jgi:hypothetical protein